MSFSIRTGASGTIKVALLDPAVQLHSGEMIAAALGSSFLGFALSLLVIGPLLDVFGAKKVAIIPMMLFAIFGAVWLVEKKYGASRDAPRARDAAVDAAG